jgi:hypothetical protein
LNFQPSDNKIKTHLLSSSLLRAPLDQYLP